MGFSRGGGKPLNQPIYSIKSMNRDRGVQGGESRGGGVCYAMRLTLSPQTQTRPLVLQL